MRVRRLGGSILGLLLLIPLLVLAACGTAASTSPPAATPSQSEIEAVFARALAYRTPATAPGQVVHAVTRFYERPAPSRGGEGACDPGGGAARLRRSAITGTQQPRPDLPRSPSVHTGVHSREANGVTHTLHDSGAVLSREARGAFAFTELRPRRGRRRRRGR